MSLTVGSSSVVMFNARVKIGKVNNLVNHDINASFECQCIFCSGGRRNYSMKWWNDNGVAKANKLHLKKRQVPKKAGNDSWHDLFLCRLALKVGLVNDFHPHGSECDYHSIIMPSGHYHLNISFPNKCENKQNVHLRIEVELPQVTTAHRCWLK